MNWPPMWVHVKIKNPDHQFGFWVPLFLLYPIVLAVLLVFSPFILLALFIVWICGSGNWALLVFRSVFVTFWALRGFKVDIQGRNDCVYISVV
jgi:hypothetical protein